MIRAFCSFLFLQALSYAYSTIDQLQSLIFNFSWVDFVQKLFVGINPFKCLQGCLSQGRIKCIGNNLNELGIVSIDPPGFSPLIQGFDTFDAVII